MTDRPEPDDPAQRLKALEEKLAARRKTTQGEVLQGGHYQGQLAWRMVIELVAGLGIGFGIGYGLDRLFGTLPIFMVIFVLLGFVAGIKTVIRSAEEVQKRQLADQMGTATRNEGDTRGD
ncbi:ATP synthase protein I [Loktanella fryxellensis]|uniref:ATP synthase protein I n=1 Tax=Loktanella fryxellensis TaxID=245187 RepID=A0A1H8CST5_9RHOB|nr:AtpZ/AtpI family protein [Loktanella fryxellensis]SEM97207.1 ATP synthase protein I [Loktanella fryxellensis]